MSDVPTVTVLIPARNEEKDIERCLRAVLAQDHPHDRMEIVFVDGCSSDRTVDLARRVLRASDITWKIVSNPPGTTPSGLNAGLAEANGDVVCRVDARSVVPPYYVRRCGNTLVTRPEVVVVGGAQVPRATDDRIIARGIARALRNPYATGLARYRRATQSAATDTVYLGAFRASDLRSTGGWDERLLTNQDYELNRRLGAHGVVWFDAALKVDYTPRSTIRELADQYRRFGRWKAASWLEDRAAPARRQTVLLTASAVTLLVSLVAARRSPVRVLAAGSAALVCVDAAAGGAAPIAERLTSSLAVGVIAASWLTGIGEQTVRYARGQRLLRTVDASRVTL